MPTGGITKPKKQRNKKKYIYIFAAKYSILTGKTDHAHFPLLFSTNLT